MCGKILKIWWKVLYHYMSFVGNILFSFQQWKNFENSLRIDKVTAISLVYNIFGTLSICKTHAPITGMKKNMLTTTTASAHPRWSLKILTKNKSKPIILNKTRIAIAIAMESARSRAFTRMVRSTTGACTCTPIWQIDILFLVMGKSRDW